MMDFLRKLLGIKPKNSFKKVDWLEVEGKLRQLEQLALSNTQAEAKQVIIQADILVDSIMKQAGVFGLTMGERLKTLRQDLPKAVYSAIWQAHIKRNELVHDSGSFVADWEKSKHFAAFKDAISAMRGIR